MVEFNENNESLFTTQSNFISSLTVQKVVKIIYIFVILFVSSFYIFNFFCNFLQLQNVSENFIVLILTFYNAFKMKF